VNDRAAVNPMLELAIVTRPPPGSTKASATPPKVHIAFGGMLSCRTGKSNAEFRFLSCAARWDALFLATLPLDSAH
jgi:hypothetical protein